MFLRKVVRRSSNGTVEYLYLIEGYREGGRVRHRVVANLGRADVLAPHAARLLALLRPYLQEPVGSLRDAGVREAPTYGPVLVARRLWEAVGVGRVVARHCGQEVAERAFVLVAHRLLHPGSEHALAWWLEESYVTDSEGRRWRPQWAARGRVRVRASQLQRWYRTLDRLLAAKVAIEQDLYLQLRDLFGLQVELVFYDLTSVYFEGRGPECARHGHSRDGHGRDRQWPVAGRLPRTCSRGIGWRRMDTGSPLAGGSCPLPGRTQPRASHLGAAAAPGGHASLPGRARSTGPRGSSGTPTSPGEDRRPAGAILKEYHGHRYFAWTLTPRDSSGSGWAGPSYKPGYG